MSAIGPIVRRRDVTGFRPDAHQSIHLVRVLRTIGPSPDAELVPEDVHLFVRVHSSSPHQRIVGLAQAVVLAL